MVKPDLDPRPTAPFTLGFTGPRVLLVHGFTGSPWDLRPLGEGLAARGFRVHAILLPGHGASPRDMCLAGAGDWRAAVEGALAELSREGERVHLAGLSMGALLASLAAVRRPESVASLALLAPALRLRGLGARLSVRLAPLGLLPRLHPWIRKEGTDIQDPAVRAQAPVLPSYPTSRLADLRRVQAWARAALPGVRAATLVMDAAQDRVVRASSAQEAVSLLRASPRVRTVHLARGGHILPRDRERERVIAEVAGFFAAGPPPADLR